MLMRNSEHRKELISEIRSLAQSQGLCLPHSWRLPQTALPPRPTRKMPKSESSDIRRWRRL